MAKKAKRKLEEDEEYKSFQFPEFDEGKFLDHEFEQSYATAIAIGMAGVLGSVAYLLDRANLPLAVALVAGVAGLVFSPLLIQRLRPRSGEYTKGDWAGLVVTMLFGWLGIWFLLLNVLPL